MKRATVITLSVIVISIIIGIYIYTDYTKNISMPQKQEQELLRKKEELQQERTELDGAPDVYSSQALVEQIARDVLGLVKSDEKFYKNYNNQ